MTRYKPSFGKKAIIGVCLLLLPLSVTAEDFSGTEGFLYLKKNNTQQYNTTDLLRQTTYFTKQKSLAFQNSQLFFLGLQNQNFLFHTLENTSPQNFQEAVSQNTAILTRINTVDIWEYLKKEEDREKALNRYIRTAKVMEKENNHYQQKIKDQVSLLAQQIKTQKRKVSSLEKSFIKLTKNQKIPLEDITKAQAELIAQSTFLAEITTEHQKLSTLHIQLSKSLSTLTEKIKAIEENYDALVKNVRVQKKSGEIINAIVD